MDWEMNMGIIIGSFILGFGLLSSLTIKKKIFGAGRRISNSRKI